MGKAEARYFVLGRELATASLEDHVKYCLRAAILTQLGERRAAVGSRVRDLLFRPLFPSLRQELVSAIRQAVTVGEPRVEVETVSVVGDSTDAARVVVGISYRIRETHRRDRLQVRL